MFILINWGTSILKSGGKWSFSYGTKALIHLSQWGEWIRGAQSIKEKRLLCEFIFILIEKRTSILKVVEREVFLMKPKLQYHLSKWEKYVSGA